MVGENVRTTYCLPLFALASKGIHGLLLGLVECIIVGLTFLICLPLNFRHNSKIPWILSRNIQWGLVVVLDGPDHLLKIIRTSRLAAVFGRTVVPTKLVAFQRLLS